MKQQQAVYFLYDSTINHYSLDVLFHTTHQAAEKLRLKELEITENMPHHTQTM